MSSSPSPPTNNSPKDNNKPYYELCPDFSHFLAKPNEAETTALENDVKKLDLKETDTLQGKIDAYCHEFLYLGGPRHYTRSNLKKEDTPVTKQNARITDQVAKESSDSNASTHPHHDVDTGATSGGSASAMAHKAHPGPVMADNMPAPETKENLKKRAEELNK
ncbi:peptidase c40 [Pyrenophora seminiperda CCB06]|uniref:Peptidase c40 n=1 Tax=Pyrenophora seminiperda CCB06 TaxID=1302712 RepID=A0A3M7MIB1_9PLEO|nr:peptidase c40 [Pyrenophora seminiperda CCB06]